MKRVERTARIAATPEELFAYLADLRNLPDWQSGIVSAEVTSGGEMGAGATARIVRQVMSQQVKAPLRITEFEPPRLMVIASEVSGVRALAVLQLSPVDGGTDLGFSMEIRGSGLTAFMEPMIAGAARGDIEASMERLRERFATPA